MSEIYLAQSLLLRRRHEAAVRRQVSQARQAAKIKELRRVLLAQGYKTLSQQAAVLGLKRPTVWAIFRSDHTRNGLSSVTVKQLLAARGAPEEVKQVIREYVRGKLTG